MFSDDSPHRQSLRVFSLSASIRGAFWLLTMLSWHRALCRSAFLSANRRSIKQQLSPHSASRRLLGIPSVPRGGRLAAGESPSTTDGPTKENSRFITYITDIEGDREYLTRYVELSRVLRFRNNTIANNNPSNLPYDHCIDFVSATNSEETSPVLVFGGDIWDQGGSDLYVIRQLLDLKRRYPHRVYLVLGNRDLNKMRLHAELGSSNHDMPPHHPGVHWLKGSQKLGDLNQPNHELRDPVERLKWMLRDTMGSPRAFEYRRLELQEERNESVSDQDVVDSYRTSCHPNGEMGEYLANAHLAVRLGSVLFVHGSLPHTKDVLTNGGDPSRLWEGDLRFAMPWLTPDADHEVESASDWIHALNSFARHEIYEWRKNPPRGPSLWSSVGGYHDLPGEMRTGAQVMQYGMGWLPDRTRNPTIVYASWGTDGMPRRFFPNDGDPAFVQATRSFFQASGLSLICSGHQPQGDMPNAIRVLLEDNSNAWILCADTSYSGDVIWHNSDRSAPGREGSLSGRGKRAVSEVLLTQNVKTGEIVEAICHGILSDGTEYETHPLPWRDEETDQDPRVGCIAQGSRVPSDSPHNGPWWTRAAFKDSSRLLVAGEAYDVWNLIV